MARWESLKQIKAPRTLGRRERTHGRLFDDDYVILSEPLACELSVCLAFAYDTVAPAPGFCRTGAEAP